VLPVKKLLLYSIDQEQSKKARPVCKVLFSLSACAKEGELPVNFCLSALDAFVDASELHQWVRQWASLVDVLSI
jgi:hypothetical protein